MWDSELFRQNTIAKFLMAVAICCGLQVEAKPPSKSKIERHIVGAWLFSIPGDEPQHMLVRYWPDKTSDVLLRPSRELAKSELVEHVVRFRLECRVLESSEISCLTLESSHPETIKIGAIESDQVIDIDAAKITLKSADVTATGIKLSVDPAHVACENSLKFIGCSRAVLLTSKARVSKKGLWPGKGKRYRDADQKLSFIVPDEHWMMLPKSANGLAVIAVPSFSLWINGKPIDSKTYFSEVVSTLGAKSSGASEPVKERWTNRQGLKIKFQHMRVDVEGRGQLTLSFATIDGKKFMTSIGVEFEGEISGLRSILDSMQID